ncbi:MAG: cell division protein FtsH, partial [Elusimicrobia bacterium]|nr:cell division protein FtsH [Elusimicrobiota bacterium]
RDFTREPRFSDKTSQTIDEEVKKIVEEAKKGAEKILKENIDKLKTLAERLLEKEILDAEEVERIFKGEPPVSQQV